MTPWTRDWPGLIARGDLRRLYEKYGIWSEAQRELENLTGPPEVISGKQEESRLGPGEPVLVAAWSKQPVSPSPCRSARCRWRCSWG